ncbi:MAG TPA: HU family DNA-binding protein [Bacteroidota bacterium]|nr:HU family DNA-binding protein [Bacteroidota bacterium]
MNGKKERKPTYTKKDIAKKLAETNEVNLDVASHWVDEVINGLREILLAANPELRIEIRDFGVFEVKMTKSKPKARNPQTGEIIFVPPHKKTHFKPGKKLKIFLSQAMEV